MASRPSGAGDVVVDIRACVGKTPQGITLCVEAPAVLKTHLLPVALRGALR